MDDVGRVQFRPGGLAKDMICRIDPAWGVSPNAGAARVAQRDLERYYALLRYALATVASDLTLAEARWVVAAHWSTLFDETAEISAAMLPSQLHDFADDPEGRSAAAAWRIDPEALIRRVQDWSMLQRAAVIDAIERLRCRAHAGAADDDDGDDGSAGGDATLDDLIIAVGLARLPT
jgi:hypothetical protein